MFIDSVTKIWINGFIAFWTLALSLILKFQIEVDVEVDVVSI
jgi:hypothetical protein